MIAWLVDCLLDSMLDIITHSLTHSHTFSDNEWGYSNRLVDLAIYCNSK